MAGRFDKGVSSYTYADVTIQVAFPEDEVKCKWCPFIRHYDGLNRDKCSLTDSILFSQEIIGHDCPLTILNNVKTEELNK
jgi:hypothetical protein